MKSSPSTYGPSRENRALRASADLYPRSIRTIEASVAFLVLYTAQRLRVYGAAVTQVSRHHHDPLYLSYTQQRLSLRTPPRRHQASSRREAPDCPYEHILFRRIVTTTAATDPPGTGAVYATLDCDLSRRLRSRASPILLPRLGSPRVASKAGRQASEQAASFSAGCGPLFLAPFSRYRHVYYTCAHRGNMGSTLLYHYYYTTVAVATIPSGGPRSLRQPTSIVYGRQAGKNEPGTSRYGEECIVMLACGCVSSDTRRSAVRRLANTVLFCLRPNFLPSLDPQVEEAGGSTAFSRLLPMIDDT